MMEQKEFAAVLGENIRTFRRLQHMTQRELAGRLHKSLACISKYENGAASIDTFTLHRIAEELGVPLYLLHPKEASETRPDPKPPYFLRQPTLYFYCPQSKGTGVIEGAMEIRSESMQATLYCGLTSQSDSRACRYVLYGSMSYSEVNIRISASNPLLGGDFVFMAFRLMDLAGGDAAPGICVTLNEDYRFRASRILLRRTRKQPGAIPAPSQLAFSKDDLAELRKRQYLLF